MSKRIISLLVAFVICISIAPVCYADSDGAYISKTSSYFDRMLHGIVNGTSGVFLLSSGIQGIASFLNSDICALSSDGYHYADSFFDDHIGEGKDGAKYAEAICKFCGEHFLCYASDLSAAYDNYVETLPATGYTSDGSLTYSPVHGYFELCYSSGSSYGNVERYCEHYQGEDIGNARFQFNFNCVSNSISVFPVSGASTFIKVSGSFYYKGTAPIDGYYTRLSTPKTTGYFLDADGANNSLEADWVLQTSPIYYAAGDTFSPYCSSPSFSSSSSPCRFAFIQGIPPVYKITPVSALSADTYNINTRLGTIWMIKGKA